MGDWGGVEQIVSLSKPESQVENLMNVGVIMNDNSSFMRRKTIHKEREWGDDKGLKQMTANRREMRWYIQVPYTSGEQDAFSLFTFQPPPHPQGGHLHCPLRNKFKLLSSCNGYQALHDLAFFIFLSHLFYTF